MSTELESAVARLRLVDHHVHTSLREQPPAEDFAQLLTESDRPPAPGTSHLESQVGFAVRRHCAPLLGLEPHVPMAEYVDARRRLDPADLDRRLLGAAGVERWLVDTGYKGDEVRALDDFAALVPHARVQEVVRLETVLEGVAAGSDAGGLAARFREALAAATVDAVGVKSVIAYRHGFDFDPARPDDAEVAAAAARWRSPDRHHPARPATRLPAPPERRAPIARDTARANPPAVRLSRPGRRDELWPDRRGRPRIGPAAWFAGGEHDLRWQPFLRSGPKDTENKQHHR
jgi:hypothetical protein